MYLNPSTRLGESSSWDSRLTSEIFKVFSHAKDLVCKPILSWDGDNIGIVLSPHAVSLTETVDLWKKEGPVVDHRPVGYVTEMN